MNVSKWIACFCLCVCLPHGHYAKRNNWVISIQTANVWMAGYVGDIVICIDFKTSDTSGNETTIADDRNYTGNSVVEECQGVPIKHFERGKSYLFSLHYAANTLLHRVKILAKSWDNAICKQSSTDAWHIEDITFHSMTTGEFFDKPKASKLSPAGHWIIKAKCGRPSKELVLDSFRKSVQPRPCVMSEELIYKNGERFIDGCSGSCKCDDSSVGCVSLCPPSIALNCRTVHVPGECCETHICEHTGSPLSCSLYEASDCETSNRTVDPGETPWVAFIKLCSRDNNTCDRFCSGAVLNSHWILTAADCFAAAADGNRSVTADQVKVIVGEHNLDLAEDSDVEIRVKSIVFSSNLALIEVDEGLSFDLATQPVTLPPNREQCLQFVQPNCALSVTGWVHTGAAKTEQYELYKLATKIEPPSACDSSVPGRGARRQKPLPPRNPHKDSGICVDFGMEEIEVPTECSPCQGRDPKSLVDTCSDDKNVYLCSGEKGRALVSKVQVPSPGSSGTTEVNYLVGIVSYHLSATETAIGLCKKPAYRLAVNICHELSWIEFTITAH